MLPNLVGQLDAIQPWHHHVDDEEIDSSVGEVERPQGFLAVLCLKDAVPRFAENAIRYPASEPLVVNYEDGGGGLWKWGRQSDLVWVGRGKPAWDGIKTNSGD